MSVCCSEMVGRKKYRTICRILAVIATVAALAVACVLIVNDHDSSDATGETSGSCGADLTWTYDPATGALTITGSGVMDDYDQFDERWGGNEIKSVVLPDGLTHIGDYAFNECSSIVSVNIPGTVTSIGDDAFCGCRALTSLVIPDSVTSVPYSLCWGCYSLKSVTIGSSVTNIRDYAFRECYSLTSVVIPDSVTYIGDNAFRDCISLMSVTLGSSLNQIYWGAFDGCYSLASVNIPASVTEIAQYAFYDCSSLKSVTIPDSVETIETDAFDGCLSLESITVGASNANYSSEGGVLFNKDKTHLILYPAGKADDSYTIPGSVKYVDYDAFAKCTALTSVTIPDSVEKIDSYAFFRCTGLKSVTIPDSVTSIGEQAFDVCDSLASITVGASNTAYSSENGVLFNHDKTTLIQYPAAKTDSTYAVPGTVTKILDFAFDGCRSLVSITIPGSVTSLGSYWVFDRCVSLTSITVDTSNTSYTSENGVLFSKDMSQLIRYPPAKADASFELPDPVTDVFEGAFYDCNLLASITVGSSNTEYSSEDGVLFNYDKTMLIRYPAAKAGASYAMPDSVDFIDDYSFSGNKNITSVSIPSAVWNVGDHAFSGCSSLASITVSKDNGSYSSDSGCLFDKLGKRLILCPEGIETITIGDKVAAIEKEAFAGSGLKEVTFADGTNVVVTYGAFDNCSALTKIVIGETANPVFAHHSIRFTDSDEHRISVEAPEGYRLPDDAVYGNVILDYGDSGDKESYAVYIAVGVAAAVVILGAAVILLRKRE